MKLFEPWEVRIARVMRRTGLPFNLARHSHDVGDPEDTKHGPPSTKEPNHAMDTRSLSERTDQDIR